MPGKSVAQKLFIRENCTVLLFNGPRGIRAALGALPAGAKLVTRSTKPVDLALIFSAKKAEMIALLRKAKPQLKEHGLMWAAYPKAGQLNTDLKRETVWECGQAVKMQPVAQIAVDDVWSALRFKNAP
jgi:hypothetical protein